MNPAFDEDLDRELLALYLQKPLAWSLEGTRLSLAVPADVFSSFQVDRGTRLLLQDIAAAKPHWQSILDVGCGYGPIALHLVAGGSAERAEAFDPDALAVAFARHNARTNGLAQTVHARGGIAYSDFADGPANPADLANPESPTPSVAASPRPRVSASSCYDAVVCNLPAKAGAEVHRMILLGAFHQLRPGGQVWLVVVEPLVERIDQILATDAVAPPVKIPHHGHVVYNYTFAAPPALPLDPYVRAVGQQFEYRKHPYRLTAFQGLSEFDSRNWTTDLVLHVFADVLGGGKAESLVVCEPGQGHLPLLAWRIAGQVGEMTVLSRDLLALDATRRNLLESGYDGLLRFVHHPAWSCPAEAARPAAALVRLYEKEGMDVNVAKLRRLRDSCGPCPIIAGCAAAFGGRFQGVLKKAGMRISARKQKKGACAFCIV
jgi:SAM-dependent methyltransferase